MTLHWWMHWFWITAVGAILSVVLLAPASHAAPFTPPLLPEPLSGVTPLEISSEASEHPKFHHDDSTLYVTLFHDAASPPTFAEDLADDTLSDTPSPASFFPLHLPDDAVTLHETDDTFSLPVNTEVTHAEVTPSDSPVSEHNDSKENVSPRLDTQDNPIEKEILESESDNDEGGETKMFARDISISSRSGKAIGREFVSSTSAPEIVTTVSSQISNHNPFITDDRINDSSESVERIAMPMMNAPSTPPSLSQSVINDEEMVKDSSIHDVKPEVPIESAVSASSVDVAASTGVPEESVKPQHDVDSTTSLAELGIEISKAPTPDWVPSFSSEEESAEEAEAEEALRPDHALANEQSDSEAVTKGLMTAEQGLDAPSIVGIVLGLFGVLSIVGGVVGFVLYRRQFLNKPQTLNDKCSNADSSGYIDDTLRVSATRMNHAANSTSNSSNEAAPRSKGTKGRPQASGTHPQANKDNSEEMYSLDNDSFLNSLEAMTIQNYWTDSVKHTKL